MSDVQAKAFDLKFTIATSVNFTKNLPLISQQMEKFDKVFSHNTDGSGSQLIFLHVHYPPLLQMSYGIGLADAEFLSHYSLTSRAIVL